MEYLFSAEIPYADDVMNANPLFELENAKGFFISL